jgi:hypothetical protein
LIIDVGASGTSIVDDFDHRLHNWLIHLRTEFSLLFLPLSQLVAKHLDLFALDQHLTLKFISLFLSFIINYIDRLKLTISLKSFCFRFLISSLTWVLVDLWSWICTFEFSLNYLKHCK